MSARGSDDELAIARAQGLRTDERDPQLVRAEAEIARTRARVASSLVALRQEMARKTDWREWVRRHPLPCVAGAFLLGAYLGSRTG